MTPSWEVEVGGPVTATPVVSEGVVYVGSWDGNLYATDLESGTINWTYDSGAAVLEPDLQVLLGITGSAAVVDGVVYVGDASAQVHAIDAATGAGIWTVRADNQPNASIWSSPVVSGNRLYIGIASGAKEEALRGSVVALNTTDGGMHWQTYLAPEGADGASVFAVPAIDEARGALYVGSQNAYSANPAPYGDPISIVTLDLDPRYKDAWGLPLLRITYDFHENDYRLYRFLAQRCIEIMEEMGPTRMSSTEELGPYNVHEYQITHNTGGAIMGDDPANSVTNKYGQVWDAPNVFVTGAALYLQNPGMNPTGTVTGLAYHTGDALVDTYLGNPNELMT